MKKDKKKKSVSCEQIEKNLAMLKQQYVLFELKFTGGVKPNSLVFYQRF